MKRLFSVDDGHGHDDQEMQNYTNNQVYSSCHQHANSPIPDLWCIRSVLALFVASSLAAIYSLLYFLYFVLVFCSREQMWTTC